MHGCFEYKLITIGSYACVGRRLALMEIRRVTADLLRDSTFLLRPGNLESLS